MNNKEIEEQMQIILNDNEVLREKVIVGKLAEDNLKRNNIKLQHFTKVYNEDLGLVKVYVRELKNEILDGELDRVPVLVERIEKLLGVR